MTSPPATGEASLHPRSRRVRRRIIAAAADLLEEIGFSAMTMDAVAGRAGCSKATLYRHWTTKAGLAMDAFLAEMELAAPLPDTGSAAEDLRLQIAAVGRAFSSPRIRQMLTGVAVHLQSDEQLRKAFRDRYLTPRRADSARALQRGVERGELVDGFDTEVFFDELMGALYFRLLISGAPLDQDFTDRAVNQIMRGVLPGPAHE